MAASYSSSQSKSTAASRGAGRAASRVVSRVHQQGTEVDVQSWAQTATGDTSHTEKSVFIPETQSISADARAKVADGEATSSVSIN